MLPLINFASYVLNCFILENSAFKTKQSRNLLVILMIANIFLDESGFRRFASAVQ